MSDVELKAGDIVMEVVPSQKKHVMVRVAMYSFNCSGCGKTSSTKGRLENGNVVTCGYCGERSIVVLEVNE